MKTVEYTTRKNNHAECCAGAYKKYHTIPELKELECY